MSMIRLLDETDAAAWRALRLEGLRLSPDAFGQTYEEALEQSVEAIAARFKPEVMVEVPVFGAFQDAALVGTCGLYREPRVKNRHRVTLWGMYVSASARGQGHGRALVAAAIAHARTMPGVLQIHLGVGTTNEPAAALYRQHGFEVYGRERRSLRHEGVDIDEDLMACFLDA